MNKKALFKNICKYIPFMMGVIYLNFGVFNFVSFSLVVIGGYIVIKNLFDYRLVRKNYNDIWEYSGKCHDKYREDHMINYNRRYSRKISLVRKRVKK